MCVPVGYSLLDPVHLPHPHPQLSSSLKYKITFSHSCDEIHSFFGLLIKHSQPHFLIFQILMSVWCQALVPMNSVWIPQALTSVSPARKVFEAGTDNVLVGTTPHSHWAFCSFGGKNEIYEIHVILGKVFNRGECKKMSWPRGHKVPKGTNSSVQTVLSKIFK